MGSERDRAEQVYKVGNCVSVSFSSASIETRRAFALSLKTQHGMHGTRPGQS